MVPILVFIALVTAPAAWGTEAPAVARDRVLQSARMLLENAQVSYVYGGRALGEGPACEACNQCLGSKAPHPKQRLARCPECVRCSLDCSHFTQLVFLNAGLEAPYLTTALMAELGAEALARDYHFRPVAPDETAPGDLLVYNGHVVLLEKRSGTGLGDIIHATAGLELKGPGMAIQRLRHVAIANFRGPLVRVLRHTELPGALPSPVPRRGPQLRPIIPPRENP